jgi:enoyl-CoA hydratase/carnithine racemase
MIPGLTQNSEPIRLEEIFIMTLTITKHSPTYWRVTLNNPPINLYDQQFVEHLQALTEQLENDDEVNIVVFDSADPDYFIAHIDLTGIDKFSLEPGPTGLAPWPDLVSRWQNASFVTVGLLRGRARGVGSEFLQALDIRFASREKAVLSQIEVGTGVIPGGGGLERLPLLIGRARALEVIIGADDFDADTAALYGWVNRAIPDVEIEGFVERFATRVASFDHKLIATVKDIVNQRVERPTNEQIIATQNKFFEIAEWPETQKRLSSLFERGLQTRGDFEMNLGAMLGPQSLGNTN